MPSKAQCLYPDMDGRRAAADAFAKWLGAYSGRAAALGRATNGYMNAATVSKLKTGDISFTLFNALVIERAARFEPDPITAETLLQGSPRELEILKYATDRAKPIAKNTPRKRLTPNQRGRPVSKPLAAPAFFG